MFRTNSNKWNAKYSEGEGDSECERGRQPRHEHKKRHIILYTLDIYAQTTERNQWNSLQSYVNVEQRHQFCDCICVRVQAIQSKTSKFMAKR